MPKEIHPFTSLLEGRSMLVKRAEVVPLEAIVRGYLSGIAEASNIPDYHRVDTSVRFGLGGVQKIRDDSWHAYVRRAC
jgi:hypothetical protein